MNRPFHVRLGRRCRKEIWPGRAAPPVLLGRIPRVSRPMALAIRFDQLVRDGLVADQAELARLGHVSRALPEDPAGSTLTVAGQSAILTPPVERPPADQPSPRAKDGRFRGKWTYHSG